MQEIKKNHSWLEEHNFFIGGSSSNNVESSIMAPTTFCSSREKQYLWSINSSYTALPSILGIIQYIFFNFCGLLQNNFGAKIYMECILIFAE
jgi:hypothetical protein